MRLICEAPSTAAASILDAWKAHEPVMVLDPRAPRAELDRLVDRLRPDDGVDADVAAVLVTSGTTGEPRGVELTWSGLRSAAESTSEALGVTVADRWLCCLPLHHVAGLSIIARGWITGVPVTVHDRFDAADVVSAVANDGVTLVSLVPTMARRLVDCGFDLGSFRRVLVGGAPVPPDLGGVAGYGLTETWGGVVHDGFPLAGTQLRIGPDDEILVRGPTLMRGYRLDPDGTAAAFTDGGWLRTGDAGRLDPDGRLTVSDRLRDIVISGGVNVSPTEVEQVLARHPAVADVCVTGAPDEEWGEVVVAWVVPADPTTPPLLDDLRTFAAESLSAAKLPRRLALIKAVPRTPGGKPLRRLLRTGVVLGRPDDEK